MSQSASKVKFLLLMHGKEKCVRFHRRYKINQFFDWIVFMFFLNATQTKIRHKHIILCKAYFYNQLSLD